MATLDNTQVNGNLQVTDNATLGNIVVSGNIYLN